jgi:hypothetical protein
MKSIKPRSLCACALSLAAICAVDCTEIRASPYVVTVEQIGSNVVATGTGQLDVTGLTFGGTTGGDQGLWPAGPAIILGLDPSTLFGIDYYFGVVSGPTSFGAGGVSLANSAAGNLVGLDLRSLPLPAVDVPVGYISDTNLGTSTFTILNRTIAQLDATPGTYTWTWGSAADQSFTIEIEATTPVPAALPLFATGIGALGLLGWRRKRKNTAAIAA